MAHNQDYSYLMFDLSSGFLYGFSLMKNKFFEILGAVLRTFKPLQKFSINAKMVKL